MAGPSATTGAGRAWRRLLGASEIPAHRRIAGRTLTVQLVLVLVVVALGAGLASVTNANLRARGIATGFDFLFRPAGVPIASASIPFTPGVDTYARAVLVGIVNTLKVSAIAIVLATVLGTLIGIARLSPNWLLSRICLVYVETVRNVPLLLQLLLWYQLLHHLPGPRQALAPLPGVFLSNRGLRIPGLDWGPASGPLAGAVLAGLLLAGGALWWRRRHPSERPGERTAWAVPMGLIVLPPLAIILALGALPTVETPRLVGLDFRGGSLLSPELVALLTGLVLYTAAFISEIVRAGILGVPRGQWEAAAAMGLSRGLTLRKIILPQTLRLVVPPMTSEYLSVIKNSSLAIVVGYQDLVSIVNTMLNDTGQAIEGVLIIVGIYLVLNLALSFAMNRYDAATAAMER